MFSSFSNILWYYELGFNDLKISVSNNVLAYEYEAGFIFEKVSPAFFFSVNPDNERK